MLRRRREAYDMDALEALAISRGFITRPEILDCGYDDRTIRDSRRSGHLVSIGPGLYAFGATYRNLPAEQCCIDTTGQSS